MVLYPLNGASKGKVCSINVNASYYVVLWRNKSICVPLITISLGIDMDPDDDTAIRKNAIFDIIIIIIIMTPSPTV